MTSSAEVADLNGNIFGCTICPLSFVAIALIFSELRDGGGIRPPPPGPTSPKKSGLNRVNYRQKIKKINKYFSTFSTKCLIYFEELI